MTISTHITRLAKIFALALAAAAFAVPAATANDGLVDDWFRDANVAATAPVTDRLVDDWFRDTNVVATAPVTDRLVDDYFRDAPQVAIRTVDRIVDDWFRDSNAVATAPVTDRLVDDYFRDANVVAAPQASASGFHWSDFGIGAGAMLGLGLLLAGISLGVLSLRHRSGTLRTS